MTEQRQCSSSDAKKFQASVHQLAEMRLTMLERLLRTARKRACGQTRKFAYRRDRGNISSRPAVRRVTAGVKKLAR